MKIMKSKIAFFLLFLGMTVNVHALDIDATCIDDNVEVSGPNQKTFYLESGDEVTITEIDENNVTVKFNKQIGTAEATHFKIKYQVGLKLVSELLDSKKYQANARAYDENDCLTSSEIRLFLSNSFGINFADVLRNEVFARHGDSFKNKFYSDLFNKTKWYKPISSFNVLELNGFEQANIKWFKTQGGSNSQAISVITDGLMAYYPFNGNANDESGNNNIGTVYGAVLANDRFGNKEKAYLFNGVDNYIQIPYSTTLNPTNNITVVAWVKANSWGKASNDNPIVLTEQNWPDKGFGMRGGANTATFFVSSSFNWKIAVTQPGTIEKGKWYMLVGAYDGTAVKVYINGKEAISLPCTGPLTPATGVMRIGALINNLRFFDGIIDDIRIYDRMLSQDEINQLYFEYGWK